VDGSRRAVTAAGIIRECRGLLEERGSDILREAIGARAGAIVDWRHYPAGDAYDPSTHAQYFFHRHSAMDAVAASGRSESGHFHLFLRAEGMPAGMTPLLLPEAAIANLPTPPQAAPSKRGARDEVSHLIAVAIDDRGEPTRLFTTNRWVTGETWYRAEDVIRLLDCFAIEQAEPSAVLNRWLGALVRLFQPEIAMLLRQRDAAVMDPKRRRRRVDVFEDSRFEEPSALAIDLDTRLAAIDRLAQDRPASAPPPQPPRLPPMAEGWGN
jgi:hypothetical protein